MRRLLLVLLVIPAPALGQPYFSTGFGLNTAPELESQRSGTSIPRTICDEYINPRYPELPECAGPGGSHSWTSVFDRTARRAGRHRRRIPRRPAVARLLLVNAGVSIE